MPDLKKMLTLEALSEALPSWLKRSTKPEYNADEIDSTLTTNQFVTASDKENWNAKGTYSKPSGGIPKSDLSSIVQTSLEKADSALQSETDPTVPSWAKQTNKPSYTQDEVADGSTYKRVTQTEKDTWSGKQNALTTPQMQAVNSGITSEGVAQIETNKDDILYSLNTGVKNLFNHIDEFSGSSTISTINNGDGTYKITGGASFASIQYASFFLKAGTYVLSGCPENGSDNTYRLELRTESSTAGTIIDYGTGATAIIENSGYYLMTIRLAGNYTAPSSGLLFKPMICEKTVWDSTNHDFQPPALPNHELTKLEAEDRAALVEQVDEGAKNEFIFGDFTTGGQVGTTVTTADHAVTVTGAGAWAKAWRTFSVTKNTTYVLSFRVTNVATVASPNYRVSLGNNHHSGGSYYGIIGCNTTGNYYITFTPPIDTDIYLVINPNYTSTAASDMPSITVDNIMICTEADWKVSQKYVPHRPSYDLVAALAQNGGFIDSTLGSIIVNADLNSINKTTFAVYNEPANLPSGITGYCYVKTSVFDENSALQELYVIQPNPVSFFRIKLNNSWTVWVQTSNV